MRLPCAVALALAASCTPFPDRPPAPQDVADVEEAVEVLADAEEPDVPDVADGADASPPPAATLVFEEDWEGLRDGTVVDWSRWNVVGAPLPVLLDDGDGGTAFDPNGDGLWVSGAVSWPVFDVAEQTRLEWRWRMVDPAGPVPAYHHGGAVGWAKAPPEAFCGVTGSPGGYVYASVNAITGQITLHAGLQKKELGVSIATDWESWVIRVEDDRRVVFERDGEEIWRPEHPLPLADLDRAPILVVGRSAEGAFLIDDVRVYQVGDLLPDPGQPASRCTCELETFNRPNGPVIDNGWTVEIEGNGSALLYDQVLSLSAGGQQYGRSDVVRELGFVPDSITMAYAMERTQFGFVEVELQLFDADGGLLGGVLQYLGDWGLSLPNGDKHYKPGGCLPTKACPAKLPGGGLQTLTLSAAAHYGPTALRPELAASAQLRIHAESGWVNPAEGYTSSIDAFVFLIESCTAPASPPDVDCTRVLFQRLHGTQMDLYSACEDGSDVRLLTRSPGDDGEWATVSPYRTKVAFERDGVPWVVGADGRREYAACPSEVDGHTLDGMVWASDIQLLVSYRKGAASAFAMLCHVGSGAMEQAFSQSDLWATLGAGATYVLRDFDHARNAAVLEAQGSSPGATSDLYALLLDTKVAEPIHADPIEALSDSGRVALSHAEDRIAWTWDGRLHLAAPDGSEAPTDLGVTGEVVAWSRDDARILLQDGAELLSVDRSDGGGLVSQQGVDDATFHDVLWSEIPCDSDAPRSITITGGSINGKAIVPGALWLRASAGQPIQGEVHLNIVNPSPPSSVFRVAAVPSWGDPATSWWCVVDWFQPVAGPATATVDLVAPTESGLYHLVFLGSVDTHCKFTASGTQQVVGAPVWGDADDPASWSQIELYRAQVEGQVCVERLAKEGMVHSAIPATGLGILVP